MERNVSTACKFLILQTSTEKFIRLRAINPPDHGRGSILCVELRNLEFVVLISQGNQRSSVGGMAAPSLAVPAARSSQCGLRSGLHKSSSQP